MQPESLLRPFFLQFTGSLTPEEEVIPLSVPFSVPSIHDQIIRLRVT